MNQLDWPITLALVRDYKQGDKTITVETTDEWAITYAAKKFDVDEEDIILKRNKGAILTRVREMGEEDYVEFITYEQFIREIYGFPLKTDPNYDNFRKFGYSNWLINTYPEEFGVGIKAEHEAALRLDYEFYRLETWLGAEEKAFEDALGASLRNQPIFTLKSKIPLNLPLKLTSKTFAILIWPEERGQFVLIIGDSCELYPFVMPDKYLVETDEVFGGFE